MKKDKSVERKGGRDVIALEDLAPRKDPKGGKGSPGKTVFGVGPEVADRNDPGPDRKEKDRRR